jgi:hypothetical protein
MNDHCPYPDAVGCSHGSLHRIPKQGTSDTSTLMGQVNGQAREDHDGDGSMCRLSLDEPDGRIRGLDSTGGEREVANDEIPLVGGYEDP